MEIELVPFRPEFTRPFIEWRSQAATARHNPLKKVSDEEIEANLIENGSDLSDLTKHEIFRWYILADGELAGSVSLKDINFMMNFGELGYGMDEKFYGQGICTKAVRMLIEKIFAETSIRKLIAYVHDENLASRRVLQKLGFKEEGLLREHFVINGRPVNEVLYGLLKNEFQN